MPLSLKFRKSLVNKWRVTLFVPSEGKETKVYQPVNAIEVEYNIYKVLGYAIYDPEDGIWEFVPGTHVIVEEQRLNGGLVLVAVKKIKQRGDI